MHKGSVTLSLTRVTGKSNLSLRGVLFAVDNKGQGLYRRGDRTIISTFSFRVFHNQTVYVLFLLITITEQGGSFMKVQKSLFVVSFLKVVSEETP